LLGRGSGEILTVRIDRDICGSEEGIKRSNIRTGLKRLRKTAPRIEADWQYRDMLKGRVQM